jgi:hypothetical protein
MTTVQFLAEWALRSSILIVSGALLLGALRVKDPSIRLAAWTAMLCGSLAIPALTAALPRVPLPMMGARTGVAAMGVLESTDRSVRGCEGGGWQAEAPAPHALQVPRQQGGTDASVCQPAISAIPLQPLTAAGRYGLPSSFDWARAAAMLYLLVAGALLLRLFTGLAMSRRLLRRSRATGRATEGIEIRESDGVAAPVTLGIVRAAIVLPTDWREWDGAKLEAVLAHERSHIRRKDPAVQLLSAIHRALLWHSPLSWFLDRRIVRLAEEASDDAAVAATRDRASYAEVLLEFMQRGIRGAGWQGVAMARYGRPAGRIHRILDGTAVSRGVTRWSVAAILALGLPLAYVAAAAGPQGAPRSAATAQPAAPAAAAPAQESMPAQSRTIRTYVIVTGNDTTSGSWNSSDPVDQEELRARFGRNFAWFRQGGNEYAITDAGVLAELQQAMEPQKEVNRMQSEVNTQQAAVNDKQAKVNSQQGEVNALQGEVNKRQDLVNRIQAAASKEDTQALIQKLQEALAELQAGKGGADQKTVSARQTMVNLQQSLVNLEQQKVNDQQHKVNEQQGRVSAEFNGRIEEILDSAVRRHLAQRLM